MNIRILEDDLVQRQKLTTIVKAIIDENKLGTVDIFQTGKPREMLEKVKSDSECNLYLLDIQIKNNPKTGLELAQDIRTYDETGIIVFITTHSEFAPKTYEYKVSAFDFIDKEWPNVKISQHVAEAINTLYDRFSHKEDNTEMFIFNNQNSNFQVPFNEILYFETTDISHKLKLVCKSRIISFYASMKSIEELDDRFIQCHRSYIVNLPNVTQIDRHENLVYFSKEVYCLITRRKIKTVLAKMEQLNQNI
ncbi:LytR/AlgR family response regulator transcription factor [Latilactobacillus sakei]|uniref:LytR/AlgR family response regulator transcription factor n=1 Tax=Latilactobacillus sakei TaxID=1599 RepID=UPI000B5ED88C|nr:LytTR family DNA-binding domain-containing protein [Latilactobacillus sakei]ASN13557.1 DNA-binding response regulator [Latilactobacillus sakei]UTB73238.1 DNA-binding response regulator [Latilactobacillus curvatus]